RTWQFAGALGVFSRRVRRTPVHGGRPTECPNNPGRPPLTPTRPTLRGELAARKSESRHQRDGDRRARCPASQPIPASTAGPDFSRPTLRGLNMDRASIYRETLRHFLQPIAPLLEDPAVTEIMVIGPERIYCERRGTIQRTDLAFGDEPALRSV